MELFTERFKLKDIILKMEKSEQKEHKKTIKDIKLLIQNIAKEYNIKEEDIEYIRKNNPLKEVDIEIKEGERAAIRWINTADVDRDNEIVLPDGADIRDFLKSMTVLYGHNYCDLPIGRDLWIKLIEGKGWLAKTVYAMHQKAEDIYNLVKGHFLNTNSIGFIPLESVSPNSEGWDEVKDILMTKYNIKKKLIDGVRRVYTKWILLEHSDVPIPSNINAYNIAVGKGFIKDESLLKDIQEEIEIIKDKEELELIEGKVTMEDDSINIEEEGEVIKIEDMEKPYPEEHACRMRDPGDFQSDSFRRMKRDSDGKEYSIIMGRLKGETTMTEQSYRYNKDIWSVSEAKKHCKDHKGIAFEPATGKESRDNEEEIKKLSPEEKEKNTEEYNALMKSLENMILALNVSETIKENKELKEKIDNLELKQGAVLNRKNKADLVEAQKKIQGVLDSATTEEEGKDLEIEIESDKKIEEGMEFDFESEPKKDDNKIDLNSDLIKDIISKVIKKEAGDMTADIRKEIENNFKKAMGKVM